MEQVLLFFNNNSDIAILISIIINVFISVLGVLPSFFLTAANITFFGFYKGTFISFLGESIGAIISFYVYRKGFKKFNLKLEGEKYKKAKRLLEVEGLDAFYLILGLRLFPFVPSGVINIFAALGKVSAIIFIISSSLGKVPALIIEAFTVLQIVKYNDLAKIILIIISLYFLSKLRDG